MALQASGAISLANLQTEFGGVNPISMSEYYRGGPYVTSNNTGVPTSGIISLSQFYSTFLNIIGQVAYTTPGTYSWVCPAGVTSVSVVCVSGGGVHNGNSPAIAGSLAYGNNIAVVPGNSYTVVVGAGAAYESNSTVGGVSYFINTGTLYAAANTSTGSARSGGGIGGTGGDGNGGTGGGGAGGYTGNGGNGGVRKLAFSGSTAGLAGAGGGGGGGGGAYVFYDGSQSVVFAYGSGSGGGVGILGQGANGAGGTADGGGGGGGSGGSSGPDWGGSRASAGAYGAAAGTAPFDDTFTPYAFRDGAAGAVRIIWGFGRTFPSTNTGNL